MSRRMDGKVAMVTGGTAGIGRATALLLAAEGAKVTVVGRREEEGRALVAEVREGGGEALFVAGNVADAETNERAVSITVERFGRLDIGFNNAGVPQKIGPLIDMDADEFDRVIGINLKGIFLAMKYQIPAMLASGGGSIINTSSVAGLVGVPNRSIYTASKHGVIGLTKAVAVEYAAQGIQANVICPGLIETEALAAWSDQQRADVLAFHPIRRIGRASEVAETVLFLASGAAGFMTGSVISIDGGVVAQ